MTAWDLGPTPEVGESVGLSPAPGVTQDSQNGLEDTQLVARELGNWSVWGKPVHWESEVGVTAVGKVSFLGLLKVLVLPAFCSALTGRPWSAVSEVLLPAGSSGWDLFMGGGGKHLWSGACAEEG